MKWLATQNIDAAKRNLKYVPEFGRWDDLYLFVGTPCQDEAFKFMKEQLALDITCKTPSLLAKWLKSENTSSQESRDLASKTRHYLGMTSKQYRKTLSTLRERINILERLMSAGKWDEIEFDKIPSRAGFIYKNAFARHDVERAKGGARTYEDFAKDTTTKVNAKTLYPYECVEKARDVMGYYGWYSYKNPTTDSVDRLMVNKYWENLADYINGAVFNGIAIVDTSGSMCGSGYGNRTVAPIDVAISIGMYCAEKNRGPYAGHFLTFNSQPQFMKVEGTDFCDKVTRILKAPWGNSTNIEAAFDMILDVAIQNHCSSDEIPQNLIIISDMEFNSCVTSNSSYRMRSDDNSLFEKMRIKWEAYGYKMPKLVFWNVDARQDNFAMKDEVNVSYVSGFSPVLFEQIMKGKTAQDLMYDKLNDKRYACIK